MSLFPEGKQTDCLTHPDPQAFLINEKVLHVITKVGEGTGIENFPIMIMETFYHRKT